MLQTTGNTVTLGLTDLVAGGLTRWFERRTGRPLNAPYTHMQQQPYVAPQTYSPPTDAAAPACTPPPEYTTSPYTPPAYTPAPEYAPAQPAYAPEETPQYAPAESNNVPVQYQQAAVAFQQALSAPEGAIYAGLAYEVHLVGPGGMTSIVDPSTYQFATGEQFVVFYRPTVPGRIEVYNINPAGRETLIDSVEIAAGQLSRLGPYEFAAMKGDEYLRLVLTPCSTPALAMVTRDIVNVGTGSSAANASGGFQFPTCGARTRSIREKVPTRDIRKVALEDGTAFALDPISAQEQTTGEIAPREILIAFRHR
ncbi:MAG TPA: hypothetical protein VIL32_03735 [Steroidobacteraceae bacterium]